MDIKEERLDKNALKAIEKIKTHIDKHNKRIEKENERLDNSSLIVIPSGIIFCLLIIVAFICLLMFPLPYNNPSYYETIKTKIINEEENIELNLSKEQLLLGYYNYVINDEKGLDCKLISLNECQMNLSYDHSYDRKVEMINYALEKISFEWKELDKIQIIKKVYDVISNDSLVNYIHHDNENLLKALTFNFAMQWLGVECDILIGKDSYLLSNDNLYNHFWNVVKINNLYYNIDCSCNLYLLSTYDFYLNDHISGRGMTKKNYMSIISIK